MARRPRRATLHRMTWSGVLLAAGASCRMGRDKALLPASVGQPLWQRQLDVLARAGAGELLVSARPEQTWVPPGVTRVTDAVPGAGPLAGLVAALACCRGTHLLVLAVDLPALPAEWFWELQRACTPACGAAGVQTTGSDGEAFEPLAAIYPRELAAWAEAALARRELALQPLLQRAVTAGLMQAVPITTERTAWFENWNHPEDTA
ncbi:MAG: molybdenum cofactor guanylyltransferase [Verrucomicrobiota bacterium]